ncbi:MAG TPA: flagellar motor switch protein FliN [Candidatus Acidoferrales bacterium]|nr:flagellar motor switch protein FliN [Candidatus Acidoferrales bacterium]
MTAESSNLRAFFTIWKESFAAVLSQLGVAEAFAILSPLTAPPAADAVPGRFSLEGALQGELLFSAPPVVAVRFAQQLMSEPIDPAIEITDSHRDAYAEFLRQVAGDAASAWKALSGNEIQLNFQATPAPDFASATATEIKISGGALGENLIQLQLNQQLCDSLDAAPPATPPAEAPAEAPPKAETAPPPAAPVEVSAPAAPPAAAAPRPPVRPAQPPPSPQPSAQLAKPVAALPQNVDLLLDVELEATIRFGAREMLLRDIFGLMPGAVVELDQIVNEPVDLLVAGRLIARGEVVVVDGNFGLRVSEVASASQRAELLQL